MLEVLESIAVAAGSLIMEVYYGNFDISIKDDLSPITVADVQAEALILTELKSHFPQFPIVAEETGEVGFASLSSVSKFFLVDPLDGTKEFASRKSDFTVNIALIEYGRPVIGVVYAPAQGIAYTGSKRGAQKLVIDAGSHVVSRKPIETRLPPSQLTAVASRSHSDFETASFLRELDIRECKSVGSSLKFCLLAEGKADVYPRFGRTMEWDTAAGDAVLRAAGGITLHLNRSPLIYGKRDQTHDFDFANPPFIAWGRG